MKSLVIRLGFLLVLAVVFCQVQALRNLAPEWKGSVSRIVRGVPRREYFTTVGWRYQVAGFVFAVTWLVVMLVFLGAS